MMEPNTCFPAWGKNLLREPDGTPVPARAAAKLLTKDQARHIAANIAKVPDLLLGLESHGLNR
jgi:hypothetical protein